MSPESLPLIATTILATLISGLLVNFFWQKWQKRAKVRWFTIAEIEIPENFGYFQILKSLTNNISSEDQILSGEAREILKYSRYKERQLFKIAIENFGKAPARKISILLAEEPAGFIASPKTGVKMEKTVDGLYMFEIDTVQANSILYLTFFESQKYLIQGVFFEGERLRENQPDKIGPYDPSKRFGYLGLLQAFSVGLWFFIILDKNF